MTLWFMALAQYQVEFPNSNAAISSAYESGGYSMKQIGEFFGLHYSWISRIVKTNNKT